MPSLTPPPNRAWGTSNSARWADAYLIAPASANTLGQTWRTAIADNLLTTLYLATSARVLVAPR